jgi:hypothetical protein
MLELFEDATRENCAHLGDTSSQGAHHHQAPQFRPHHKEESLSHVMGLLVYALVSAWEFVWPRAWIGKVRGGRLPAAKCGGKSVVSEHSSVLAPCIREPVQCLYTKQFLYEKGSIKGKIKSAKQDMR